MRTTRMFKRAWLGFAAATIMSLIGPRPLFVKTAYAAPPVTPIEEVVMYAIDADTYELLRYAFDTDEFIRIGVVVDESGSVVEDVEALTYIPNGPYKGFYGGANYYETKPSRIVKINAMDATAETLPADVGYEKVEGLVAVQHPVTGEWRLLASTENTNNDDGDPTLIWIDPATGAGTHIMDTNENYDGLTLAPDGTVYGINKDAELWVIDPVAGTETKVASIAGFDKTEALEWAFGDFSNAIDVGDAVPDPSWTANGVLFSFSDDSDALMIVNPATGEAVEYVCSFQTIDCEGLVFTTQFRDSFGEIVVDACD